MKLVEDFRLRSGEKRKELTQRTQRSERRGHGEENPRGRGEPLPYKLGRLAPELAVGGSGESSPVIRRALRLKER